VPDQGSPDAAESRIGRESMPMTTLDAIRVRTVPSRRILRPDRDRTVRWGPLLIMAGAIALCFAGGMYLVQAHSTEVLPPVISALLFTLGGVVAAVAWSRPPSDADLPNYRDVAGALVLLGICVAAAIEPDQMVRLVEGNTQP
jgi:hypothetical protein